MDELTCRMHHEFTLSDGAQRRHDAFAVFQLVSDKITLDQALSYLQLSFDEVRAFIADWNALSTKPIAFNE